ncbi:MAG: extracellular solute-binding protein [Anaerolineae bacterium]|nr:extracellular solute-binding protein [Anaerolineae bacterium]
MQRRVSRRGLLRGVGAMAGAGVLAACAAAQPAQVAEAPGAAESGVPAAATTGPVEIGFYEWGDINDTWIAEQTIADFHEAYPDIRVRLQQPVGSYYEKLQTALAGGVAPEVINCQTWRFQQYAGKGSLAPLDEYRARDDWNRPWPSAYERVYDPQTKYRGKLYGSPWNMNAMVIFYSKEAFDKLGLDYPTDDWTLDEFKGIAEALTHEDNGVKYYGYQTNTSYERLACWMRLDGDKEWDTEVDPHEARWDQQSIMDALNYQLYEVMNTARVSPTPAEMQGGTNTLQTGNVAMKMEGPWFLPQMMGPQAKREGGTPFDVVLLPKGKDGNRAHMCFGHVLTMNAARENKDAAWEFIKFSGGPDAQRHVAEGGRQPGVLEDIGAVWAPLAREQYSFENTDAFSKGFDTGIVHLCFELSDTYFYNEVLKATFDAMVAGDATAYELMPEANDTMQKIIDDYWSRQV